MLLVCMYQETNSLSIENHSNDAIDGPLVPTQAADFDDACDDKFSPKMDFDDDIDDGLDPIMKEKLDRCVECLLTELFYIFWFSYLFGLF